MIATDPRAGADDGGRGLCIRELLAKVVAHIAIDRGDLLQQAQGVVTQPHLDLILDPRPHTADQRGLPECSNATLDETRDLIQLILGAGSFSPLQDAGALAHLVCDIRLHVEDGAAPSFRGVSCHHRSYVEVLQGFGNFGRTNPLLRYRAPGVVER